MHVVIKIYTGLQVLVSIRRTLLYNPAHIRGMIEDDVPPLCTAWQCLSRFDFSAKLELHSVHVYGLRFSCTTAWCRIWFPRCENRSPQCPHSNGFIRRCTDFTCLFKSDRCPNRLLHLLHTNGLSFRCTTFQCFTAWSFLINLNEHTSHLKGRSPLCCALLCAIRLSRRPKVAGHLAQACGRSGAGTRVSLDITTASELLEIPYRPTYDSWSSRTTGSRFATDTGEVPAGGASPLKPRSLAIRESLPSSAGGSLMSIGGVGLCCIVEVLG